MKQIQKLLLQAQEKYPIGTKVNNKNLFNYDGRGGDFTVTGSEIYITSSNVISISSNSVDMGGSYSLYRQGIWADITEKVVTDLDKARQIIYSE